MPGIIRSIISYQALVLLLVHHQFCLLVLPQDIAESLNELPAQLCAAIGQQRSAVRCRAVPCLLPCGAVLCRAALCFLSNVQYLVSCEKYQVPGAGMFVYSPHVFFVSFDCPLSVMFFFVYYTRTAAIRTRHRQQAYSTA